jgi:lipopolysaccharide export system permease protein
VQGRLKFALGWWPIHAAMIAIAVFMFAWQLGLLRRRPRK